MVDVVRINYLATSPYTNVVMPFSKNNKISELNGIGIYAMRVEMLEMGFDLYLRRLMYFAPNLKSLRFLIMKVEDKDVIRQNPFEIAFSKGLVIEEFNLMQFVEFSKKALPNLHSRLFQIISICEKSKVCTSKQWLKGLILLQGQMLSGLENKGFNTSALRKTLKDDVMQTLKKDGVSALFMNDEGF